MKKALIVYLSALIIIPSLIIGARVAFSSDTSNAKYYGVINATNNSTLASAVSVNISGITTSEMISQGWLNASATNYAIQYSGSDIKSMPGWGSNPWIMFVSSIADYAQLAYTFYSDDVTGYTPSYFPGATGMSVSDDATLELSDNFTIALTDTYFYTNLENAVTANFTVSADGSEIYANNAVYNTAWTAASGTLEAANRIGQILSGSYYVLRYGLTANTTAIPDNAFIVDAKLAFVATIDQSATDFDITIQNGQPTYPHNPVATGDYNKAYYSGDGGSLTTAGVSTTAYNLITLSATGRTWIDPAGFTRLILRSSRDIAGTAPAGNEYIGLEETTSGEAMMLTVTYVMPYLYKQGAISIYNSAANTITANITGGTSVSVAGLASDEYDLAHYENSVNCWLQVGSSVSANVAAAAVPNTAYDWYIGGLETPYITSATVTVGGNTKGSWAYEHAATFTDASGNGNTGTPSYRTTSSDADVSAELTLFASVDTPIAPAFAVGEGPDWFSGNITMSGNFTTGNVTLNYPGKALIEGLATATATPAQLPLTFISGFFILAMSILLSAFLKLHGSASLFVKAGALLIMFGIATAVQVYDFWMVLFLIIFAVMMMFASAERSNA